MVCVSRYKSVETNALIDQFFSEHEPSRSAVQVARLPKDVAVEIECVAVTAHKL